MAVTAQGAQISEEHRRRQVLLRGLITAQLLQVWGAFSLQDVDTSWTAIEPAVMAIVANGRRMSELLAENYYRDFRLAEGIRGGIPDLAARTEWRAAAQASLQITGPIAAKRLLAAKAPRAAEVAFVRMSGAATRIVANGGRDVLIGATSRDRRSVGYARVTSPKPCAFCAMLAGRGPQYRSAGTAGFHAHDHCSCYPEPVFDRRSKWPGRGREFQDLYKASTQGEDNPLAAFRRAYENA